MFLILELDVPDQFKKKQVAPTARKEATTEKSLLSIANYEKSWQSQRL
jgi:hypothetical protein